jgi:ribonuclease T1
MSRIAAVKLALTSFLTAVAIGAVSQAQAWEWKQQNGPQLGSEASVHVTELPRQGRETYELIRQGGPFPLRRTARCSATGSGSFRRDRGHYREYTVQTPGSRDRGARRIVCGGPVRTPNACYYTADHYASFRMIVE